MSRKKFIHQRSQGRNSSQNQFSKAHSTPRTCGCTGVLELHPNGYGFLRRAEKGLARSSDDVYVSRQMVAEFELKEGALISGLAEQRRGSGSRLKRIIEIESQSPEFYRSGISFDERTPQNPDQWLRLEHDDGPLAMRVLDLLCPIAKGQRALIASPPRAGKTTLLKQIGASISRNHPEVELIGLLVDERPEEVTEIRSELNGQVFASSIDQTVESHARLSQFVMKRCQRMAEAGRDVFLLVDSLTRMARAFNKLQRNVGPVGTGGLNIRALDIPKNIFASARNFREGGSLTIVASVLIETQNRMDDVIFREFKGTGNLDLVLDQTIAEHRIWPAVDITSSATRRIELIHDAATHRVATALRRTLSTLNPKTAIEQLVEQLAKFPSNDAFVQVIGGKLNLEQDHRRYF